MAATVIQAEPNITYVLQAQDGEKPIAKLVTKRVGNDLHITTEDGDIQQPQIIIQNYAEHEPSTAFATTVKLGNLAYFNAESGSLFASHAETDITTLTASGATGSVATSPWLWAAAGTAAIVAAQPKSTTNDTSTTSDTSAALSKITAYASTGTGTAPLASDYNNAGFFDINPTNVSAFNSAMAAVKADSSAKVNAVVAAYTKILTEANGTNADATSTDPLLSDYQTLGVQPTNTLSEAQNANYLSLLNDIVKSHLIVDVSTVSKLNALSTIAEKVILIAAGNTSATTTLSAADFATMGLTLTIPNSLLISAIEASNNEGSGVNNLASIKAIDMAYAKISTAADGIKANAPSSAKLSVSDFSTLGLLINYDSNGVTGTTGTDSKAMGNGAQKTAALNLLNDVLDGKTITAVATATDINKLSILVDKVMDTASGMATSALTVTDLVNLGLSSVSNTNLQKVINNIAASRSADGTAVDSLSELQALVGKAVVQAYAEDQSGQVAAPTLQDYKDSGLTNAATVTWTENLKTGVNSVLANKHNYALVADIALNYQSILNEATNGVVNTNANPTSAQYSSVLLTTNHVFEGGVLGATSTAHDNALSLMNEVIGHKAQLNIDTVSELEAIANIVDHLINTTAATTATNLITLSELTTLGLGNAGNSNLANFNQTAFNTALRNTADTGANIHSWAELQLLVNSNA